MKISFNDFIHLNSEKMKSINHRVHRVLHKGHKDVIYRILTLCPSCLLCVLCG
jgi:hypothetical protein